MNLNEKLKNYLTHEDSYNKKLVTWLDLNLQVARYNKKKFTRNDHEKI